MSNSGQYSLQQFFAPLDIGFINVENQTEPLVWQTSDFLVQSAFELPIPTTVGSLINFSFSTKGGDISFGVRFLSYEHPVEIITENARIPSDTEVISGTFRAPRAGALVLIFDNTFSWFTSKLLSYRAELTQPSFVERDTARCMKCRSMLQVIVDDTKKQEILLLKNNSKVQSLQEEILKIEDRLCFLMADVGDKRHHLQLLEDECSHLRDTIDMNIAKEAGLCIRCLDRRCLGLILSYLGGTKSSACTVNKLWFECANAANSTTPKV